MANKIQIKRGNEVNLPSLDKGEMGLCVDTEKVFIGSIGNLEIITKKSLDRELKKFGSKLELNIKDFGAKGDGVTDDTNAFESAFAYIKTLQTDLQYSIGCILKIPYGVYIISKGFNVDVSVGIVGEGQLKTPAYKLFGKDAHNQDMSPNCSTIKFNTPKSNVTMFKPVFSTAETTNKQFRKDFYLENIMLDGNDGLISSTINPSGKGVKDLIITFTGNNCNGVDMSGIKYMKGSNNLFLTGFSGFGLKTYHWQQHNNLVVNLCNIGVVTGGDGGFMSPYIAFCRTGIQVGDDGLIGATDRMIDVRIEWIEEYGILIKNGGSNRISGFIDRCGYSGICHINEAWNINIDVTIQRCGCVWRGGTRAELNTDLRKQQGSNMYLKNARGGNYRVTHIKSGSRDTSESEDIQAPVIASCIEGGQDFLVTDSTRGFTNTFFNDYIIEGIERYTILVNGFINSSSGIRVDSSNNKQVVDLFDQSRFRPVTNWGKFADSVGENGDIMYDTKGNTFYGKKNGVWVEL